jgi:DNA-binding CsgD family transcriptional regulator
VYYRPKDIDTREVLQLLRNAQSIPQQMLPFKGILHVIDYTQRRHVGISGPLKVMTGYAPAEIMDNGLGFVVDIMHKDDFEIYNQSIFTQIIAHLKSVPFEEHPNYNFSFSYRMKKKDGKWMHLYQQGSYITDPETNLPLYSLAMVTDISDLKRNNTSMIFTIDKKNHVKEVFGYQNILTNYYYPDAEEARLSGREREILGWLADGLSSKQIADKLFISESTVVNHRKNMLKKTNAKNIAELIRYGISKGFI